MMSIEAVDLNLILVLHHVLVEGTVAGAAERLHVTPSAVSNSLARLRELVGDPRRTGDLLTLVGRERIGYVVTPRSEEARLAAAFGERVSRTLTMDGMSVLVIAPEPRTPEDRSR